MMETSAAKRSKSFYLLTAIAALAYIAIAYFTPRSNFPQLITLLAVLAGCSYFLYKCSISTKDIFSLGIIFRLVIFFAVPFLSQDVYRFIWDGELITHGINPYAFTPNEIISNAAINFPDKVLLYEKMGNLSARYNSNYPPVNQLFFAIAAFLGSTSLFAKMLILKSFVLLADIGIFSIGKKLLLRFKMEENRIALYFLNPLVILELTGNLHFEGVMLFFFLLGSYLLLQKQIVQASIFVAMAIATKLVPLMLLPFFVRRMTLKQNVLFFSILFLIAAALFYLCFGLDNIGHYLNTLALWFNNFEFNASIYYVLKEIGLAISGYNMIAVLGKILPAVSVLIILLLVGFDHKSNSENVFPFITLALATYLLLSTTVHPWYIVTLLGLSIFTHFRFILLWSILVFISYHAYSINGFNETGVGLLLEYVPVYYVAFLECRRLLKNVNPNERTKR